MALGGDDGDRRKPRAELGPEERRLRALENIADELHLIRGHFADVSLWVAHIGRNMPVGRGRP